MGRLRLPHQPIIFIANYDKRFRLREHFLRHLTQTVLYLLNRNQIVLGLVFVTDRTMKRMNKRFLKHDWHTDVLAFPGPGGRSKSFLGEIIIAPNRARIWARRYGMIFQEELMRYVCHGILHLLGFRDDTLRKRNAMRLEENRLLYAVRASLSRIGNYGHS